MKTAITSIKYTALAIALAAGLAFASSGQAESQRPERTSEQRQVGAFQNIDLSGPYRVVIKAQGTPSLAMSGSPKLLAEVETRVSGDTLIVRPVNRGGMWFSFGRRHDDVVITITTAALKGLKMSGSGDVELDQVNADKLAIEASGPGDLTASGSVRELSLSSGGPGDLDLHRLAAASVNLRMSGPGDVRLSSAVTRLDGEMNGPGELAVDRLQAQSIRLIMNGPGDASLEGDVALLTAEVRGPGNLEASRLNIKNATVRSRGPGDIELATVSESLDAELRGPGSLQAVMAGKRLALNMTGPGDAEITGTVDTVNAQLSGSGDLDARHLLAGTADVVVRGPGSAVVNVKPKGDAKTAMLGRPHLLHVDRRGSSQTQQ